MQCDETLETGKRFPDNLTCDLCRITFTNYNLFKHHIFEHLLKCSQCDKKFTAINETQLHILNLHSNNSNTFMCFYCGFNEESAYLLKKHINNHCIDLLSNCKYCNLLFYDNLKLQNHLNECESYQSRTNDNKFKCNICYKTFKKQYYLKSHKALHTEELCFNCPICNKSFSRKYNMEKHIPVHREDNYCKICCLSYCSLLGLQQHLSEHDSKNIENYEDFNQTIKCNDCTEVFVSRLILYHHRNEKHLGIKEIKCNECNCSFKTLSILETHRKTHEKTLSCNVCDKKFTKKSMLEQHFTIHTGKKSYNCEYCKAAFRCHSNLLQHRLRHTETRKYKCVYCDKKFIRSNTFQEHMRIHLNKKPYRCDYCNKDYTQSSVLGKHIQKMHRICQICGLTIGNKLKMLVHVWKEHPKDEDQITAKP